MSANMRYAPAAQRFASVVAAARLQLCVVSSHPEVRQQHLAALLAWTPGVERIGDQMVVRFAHGPTAMWVTEVLPAASVELLDIGADGGTVAISTPQRVLGPYGYRQGRWVFQQGMLAAAGISRGAVHAAGVFNGQGMKVVCPNPPMMLTLTAVMKRVGIEDARPVAGGDPRVLISGGSVAAALERLGISAVTEDYLRLRDTKGENAQ